MTRRWLAVLLVASVGCWRPVPTVIPPVPAFYESRMGPVPVVWVDSLRAADGTPLLGGFSTVQRVIYISRQVTDPTARLAIFFHENCHVILLDSGVHNLIPPVVAQAVCDAWATQRVAEVRRGRP